MDASLRPGRSSPWVKRAVKVLVSWGIDYVVAVVAVTAILGAACYLHRLRGDELEWTASAPVQWLLNLGAAWSILGFLAICVGQRLVCRLASRRSPGVALVERKRANS